ncbi:MAG: cation-translocating P-type ATPase [Coriobacteriia bacterium]|nr:cation-translocating P-type ATPase [Coriobacteriia bacterium]
MESLKPLFKPLEDLLDAGGARKDVALLVTSALFLAISFAAGGDLAVDPAWVAIILCGVPIVIEAFIAIVTEFDVKADLLVSLALIASVAIGEYFAAGEVALIMQLGGLLEELTVERAQKGIQRLVELAPRQARVVEAGGKTRMIDADDAELEQVIRVLPGETVPVDGVVVSGATSIDESAVTGEPMPVDKLAGDEVSAGTVNQFGSIDVRATHVGEDSSIRRMARLVQSADAGKARIVRLADRWATWVVVGALAAAAGVYLVTGEILRSVTVLVVFCPCSLVLATPTAIVAAIGNATKRGFLVKEGDALERLAEVGRVVFDKTGTVTLGKPEVVAVVPAPGSAIDADELFSLVASAELRSEHPLGKAIVRSARERGIEFGEPIAFAMEPGRGVTATVGGREVRAGGEQMMSELGINTGAWGAEELAELRDSGDTLAFIAVDGHAAGVCALSDVIRPESAVTVAALRAAGAEPVLLTGDNEAAADAVCAQVGISAYQAGCRPEDKMAYIERSEAAGERCAMVGDGINDAPALKRSFVGIAVGGAGSDVAVEAADIAIVNDDISALPHLIELSRHTMRVIRANLTFSMGLNFLAIVLAFLAVLDPVSGALVHNCGSVLVIVNSSLLLRWEKKS